jgi:hypothetical protein
VDFIIRSLSYEGNYTLHYAGSTGGGFNHSISSQAKAMVLLAMPFGGTGGWILSFSQCHAYAMIL